MLLCSLYRPNSTLSVNYARCGILINFSGKIRYITNIFSAKTRALCTLSFRTIAQKIHISTIRHIVNHSVYSCLWWT